MEERYNRTTAEILSHLSEESFGRRLPVVIFLVVVAVLGFLGNALVLLVYILRFRPSVTRVFIIAMAVSDLLTSVVGIPLQLVTIRHAYDTYSTWLCRGMFAAVSMPTQVSSAVLVLIARVRRRRVCQYPRQTVSKGQALMQVCLACFLIALFFTPIVSSYGVHSKTVGNVTAKMCWTGDHAAHTAEGKTYFRGVLAVIFTGELTALVLAYSLVGYRLWLQWKLTKCTVSSGTLALSLRESTGGAQRDPNLTSVRLEGVAKDNGNPDQTVATLNRVAPRNPWKLSTISEQTEPGSDCFRWDSSSRSQAAPQNLDSNVTINSPPTADVLTSEIEETSSNLRPVVERPASSAQLTISQPITCERRFPDSEKAEARGALGSTLTVPHFPKAPMTEEREPGSASKAWPKSAESRSSLGLFMNVSSSSAPSHKDVNAPEDHESASARTGPPSSDPLSTIPSFAFSCTPSTALSSMAQGGGDIGFLLMKPSRRTALIVLTFILLYVTSWFPHLLIRLLYDVPVNWCNNFVDCGWNSYAIGLRSYYINTAFNAFVYNYCNPKFRRECFRLFSCGVKTRRKPH